MKAISFFGASDEYREISEQMLGRVDRVLLSGQVLGGADVAIFEQRIAAICNRRHAVALGSGTDALYFALIGAGIGPGDEVLVQTITFIASASAILRTGARPIFVDIGDDHTLDLESAARRIGPNTRALVYVHLFGSMGNPIKVQTFAQKNGIIVIEDFAQSFGASHNGCMAGSLGLASSTSFDPTKILGAPGSGGALLTDDDELAARARRLRLHGKQGANFEELGYNSQLPTLSAAILDLKLDYFDEWTRRRSAIATRYISDLANLPLKLPMPEQNVRHVWHKFVIEFECRDDLAKHLTSLGIPTRIHYPKALHQESIFGQKQRNEDFPIANKFCNNTLSLPINSHLDEFAVDKILNSMKLYFDL